jgi:hypothetical protein
MRPARDRARERRCEARQTYFDPGRSRGWPAAEWQPVTPAPRAWGGCLMGTPFSDFTHYAHDFADRLLCGLPLAGTTIRESYDGHGRRVICPGCARAAEQER